MICKVFCFGINSGAGDLLGIPSPEFSIRDSLISLKANAL